MSAGCVYSGFDQLITFDEGVRDLGRQCVQPDRRGPGDSLRRGVQNGYGLQEIRDTGGLSATLTGFSRKTAMMPVISDFLFDDAPAFLQELSQVNNIHDVFI